MIIEEVTYKDYCSKVSAKIFFNRPEFNFLNKDKVDSLRYFLFKDKKYRFALCVGQRENFWYAPFSAPFATFVNLRDDWSILQLEDAVKVFNEFIINNSVRYVKFILPPAFYAESLVSSLQNIFLRSGYSVKYQDLNFSLKLNKNFLNSYVKLLPSNGRKNLNSALNNNLNFNQCKTVEDKKIAYNIIKANRKLRGYPLKMTWEQVCATINLVDNDFFIVTHDNESIAAAIVFHVKDDIVQVIYWGDIPEFSSLRPTNFLAYKLICYYSEKNFKYIDIGPSTEFGMPNYGLCDFKRSIGCQINSKVTFEKNFFK